MKSNILLFIGGLGGWEILLLLLPAVLWIWALIDLLQSRFTESINKLIWALVIIFVPFLGPVLYLTIGRRQKVPS